MSTRALSERLYPNYRSESDMLDDEIRGRLRGARDVLDVGCGSGSRFPREYRGDGRRVIGVDPDSAIEANARLDARVRGLVESLPFREGSFDLIYSRYVLEHMAAPQVAFREFARVLRPGGSLVLLTPNRWHYVAIAARLTPHRFHALFNARMRSRAEEDTFPTLYRANTARRIKRFATEAGLMERKTRLFETRPNYLMWGTLPFLMGVLYERLVSSTELLAFLRVNILAVYEKPRARSHEPLPVLAAPKTTELG